MTSNRHQIWHTDREYLIGGRGCMYGSNEVTSRPAPRALQKRESRVTKR